MIENDLAKQVTEEFNLEAYLSSGIEMIIKTALRASYKNPKQSIYLAQYAIWAPKARKLRRQSELKNEHIPPFLICSIATNCNLHCAGCYARANHACEDHNSENLLDENEWNRIFHEAKELGVGFILLAGGEPLLRPEIIQRAAEIPELIFPIFTNGTLVGEEYLQTFKEHRNLLPIISLEGGEKATDGRRGAGVFHAVVATMDRLNMNQVFYGVSITVTKKNIKEVTSDSFLKDLHTRGCKVVFYVEYVPVSDENDQIAPEDVDREYLECRLRSIRSFFNEMIFLSFPGDEKHSGGCLAAGRGFFHINAQGGAEPCPFSPYSDRNLKNLTLREALKSDLFERLRNDGYLNEEHTGGCVLFGKRNEVERLSR